MFNTTDTKKITSRFHPNAGTCFSTNYENIFQGISLRTKETFFFTFIIQFLLVSLMYIHVGQGKYWRVLFYASTAGLIGALIEHTTLAFICQKGKENDMSQVPPFFIEEFFWIICEYAVPYLNLIKMEAISKGRAVRFIKSIIYVLLIPFSAARLYDGYDRMVKGYLNTDLSRVCHGVAFGTMAVADIICTIFIIYFIKAKKMNGTLNNNGLTNQIKNSSYTILICVDIVSLILSVLYIVSSNFFPEDRNLESSTSLFHCLKSVFILILATDALIFKYGVNNNSSRGGGSSTKGQYNDTYYNSNTTYKSYNNTTSNTTGTANANVSPSSYSIDMTSSFKQNLPGNMASPYHYPSSERKYSNQSPVKQPSTTMMNSKTIVKNYSDATPSSYDENKDQFGFLYQTNDYSDLIYKGEGKNK
ncbi:hypothetical protein PIROE2DRAFT_11006 [Piromyces sp. E2]|nr:hypothetical protein PIROE2DRAFT_11006 [Piromyces sp. E2]|eukprot:OUM62632.1 hypothetical protein PIROE2DRAFT_11006 [Piromyces sp. E2]